MPQGGLTVPRYINITLTAQVSLYHLGRDPQETTNLAHLHPHLVAELLAEAEAVVAAAPPEVRSGGQKIFCNHTKNISGCG